MRSSAAILTLALASTAGCDRTPEAKPDVTVLAPSPRPAVSNAEVAPSPAASPSAPPTTTSYRLPAAARVVAIGDLHGDLDALRATLRLAGAIDSDDRWIGKDLTVVQTGDQVDRGDRDREVLDVIEKLEADAHAAGGAFYVLIGNHELMNASFDFRYVSRKSFGGFADLSRQAAGAVERLPEEQRGRGAAFAPGGSYARKLAKHQTVALVGDSLFAHGGVLPVHVDYGLDRINREASDFLNGKLRALPPALSAEDSPVWTRFYGGELADEGCQVLKRVLDQVGAKRLVVGHTVQQAGINGACQDRVFRIDVGLSAYYGEHPAQVLEITSQGARVLKAGTATDSSARSPKKSQPASPALH
ncbi:MAG TPA: metallophosphoesterase [Polyangiaceae bacterium]|nr:metallophosphoesterase [Polyangiaceae bacterium]